MNQKILVGSGFTGMQERIARLGGRFKYRNLNPGLEILITVKK